MKNLIEKDSRFYKECDVIILSTKYDPTISLSSSINGHLNFGQLNWDNANRCRSHHIYIISEDEIQMGDFYYTPEMKTCEHGINLCASDRLVELCKRFRCKKIIATTDKSLKSKELMKGQNCPIGLVDDGYTYKELPAIPNEFIKEYVEKGGINKVLVEYTGTQWYNENKRWQPFPDSKTNTRRNIPKVNPDNTINIKLIEEKMYSKDEVEMLCLKAMIQGVINAVPDQASIGSKIYFKDWIVKNLK